VALVAVSYMATGILSPAWGDLLAKAVPTDRWGAFWGWLTALGSGASVLGAAAVTGVLGADRLAFPGNYALLFWGATALTGVSYVFFLLNREPLQPVPPRPESLADYLRSLVAAVRGHRSFRNLLVANVLAATYNIGAGFFMVHAIRRFAVGDAAAGQFLMISTVVGAVAAPVLGRWADRWGHRLVLAAGRGLLAAALALALAAWRAEVLSAVFALAAVGGACGLVTGQNLLLKLAPPGQRPSYLGLASTVTTPFVIAFSVVGGWLADATGLGYRLPMALAAVCCGASVIVLVAGVRGPAVAEPPRAA